MIIDIVIVNRLTFWRHLLIMLGNKPSHMAICECVCVSGTFLPFLFSFFSMIFKHKLLQTSTNWALIDGWVRPFSSTTKQPYSLSVQRIYRQKAFNFNCDCWLLIAYTISEHLHIWFSSIKDVRKKKRRRIILLFQTEITIIHKWRKKYKMKTRIQYELLCRTGG